jgi:hypothetical protein
MVVVEQEPHCFVAMFPSVPSNTYILHSGLFTFTPQTLAVRCWHSQKSSMFHSSSDMYFSINYMQWI